MPIFVPNLCGVRGDSHFARPPSRAEAVGVFPCETRGFPIGISCIETPGGVSGFDIAQVIRDAASVETYLRGECMKSTDVNCHCATRCPIG